MKEWFRKLNKKYRTWIHTVLAIIVWVIIPCSSNDNTPDLLYLLWLTLLIVEIILIVWSVKMKKMKKHENISKEKENQHIHQPSYSTVSQSIERKPQSMAPVVQKPCGNACTTKKDENITRESPIISNFSYPINTTFFFVDVETATRSNDSICAIGAIIVKNGKEENLYSLINPKMHITNTSIHGISDEDVVDAPTIDEYWDNIIPLLGDDYIIVGHNIAFDISVISKDLERFGIDFNPKRKVDTMAIAKDILYKFSTQAGDLKLNTICQKLNISLNHHNAESDIAATKQVLEMLLIMGNRNITDFINLHYSSAQDNFIGNIKTVSVSRYWDDIEAGRTPVYFTNWKKVCCSETPEYDEVEIETLQYCSMMDRTNCGIKRIANQIEIIKNCVEHIGGKIYGKGAKKAKCYIEFYYMDIEEYKKLKALGYKIYHAINVEAFIAENQEIIQKFVKEQAEKEIAVAEEKERLQKEREERKVQREPRKVIPQETPKKTARKVAQMNDERETITIFESISEAVRTTGINSKSIRDCCNGVQKHAGGFIWQYVDDDE